MKDKDIRKKINNSKLSDEALEGVSGGTSMIPFGGVDYCPYCGETHEKVNKQRFIRDIVYNGINYKNCQSYTCYLNGFFYVATTDEGNTIYFDSNYQKMN